MTTYINACTEHVDLGNGQYRRVIGVKPVAYLDGGSYHTIDSTFVAGDQNFPNVITTAQLKVYRATDGLFRICPTGDPTRYAAIGAPCIKPSSTWNKVSLGTPTITANTVHCHNASLDTWVRHGGHFLDWQFELLGGYVPPNSQVAFPVDRQGLTQTGRNFYQDGVLVMHLQEPQMIDLADPEVAPRPITYALSNVSGQWYIVFTLPSLAGLARPCIDPTFSVQPDASAGKDTWISSTYDNKNYGIRNNLYLGGGTITLICFSVASVPAGSTCTAATFYCWLDAAAGGTKTVTIYSVASGNNDWIEGASNGAINAGEPCWSWKGYNTVAWAGSAGMSTADTDYESASLGSFVHTNGDAANTAYTAALATDRIAQWFGSDALNYGLMLKSSGDFAHIWSSDHTTPAYRPKISIDYTLCYQKSYIISQAVNRGAYY
jgi:hypothetical protein